jgi:hypothetical protein
LAVEPVEQPEGLEGPPPLEGVELVVGVGVEVLEEVEQVVVQGPHT